MILMPNIHVIQMCCCHPCLLLDLMAISPRLLLYTEITITTVFTTEFNCTMFIFTSVPGEPRNVAARPLNSSSIVVTWNAPEDEEKHGIIRGYQIYVQPRKSVSADIHSSRNWNDQFLSLFKAATAAIAAFQIIMLNRCCLDWTVFLQYKLFVRLCKIFNSLKYSEEFGSNQKVNTDMQNLCHNIGRAFSWIYLSRQIHFLQLP